MKKLFCLLLIGLMLLCFAACGESELEEQETAAAVQDEEFKPFVIAKENAARIEINEKIVTYKGEDFNMIEYDGVKYISKTLASGNLQTLYKFSFDFTLQNEATQRSGNGFIYFTENSSEGTGGLYAYFIPSGVEMKIVSGNCSDFVLLDVPENYEMYPYGFIVNSTDINVIDLKDGDISSYSKSISDIKIYIDAPEYFFGSTLKTELSALSRTHLLVKTHELNSKGEVKSTVEFTFNPILGVVVENK